MIRNFSWLFVLEMSISKRFRTEHVKILKRHSLSAGLVDFYNTSTYSLTIGLTRPTLWLWRYKRLTNPSLTLIDMSSESKKNETQWAWQGVKLTRLKFLIKNFLTKSDPKRTRGWKVPCLILIKVKAATFLNTLMHM